MTTFTVSQLAAQTGTTADTLRYYERIGLVPPPERTPAGYRQYGAADAERVRFIKRAQRFGLRLDDISDLLRIREEGSCPCGHTRQLLADRLTQLDAELAELGRLRGDVARMLTDPGQLRGDDQTCGGTPILARDTPTARRPPMTGTTTCQCGCSPADRAVATTTGGCQCGCAAAATSGIAPGGPCSCGCGDSPPSPQEEIVDLQRRRAQIDERLDELGSES